MFVRGGGGRVGTAGVRLHLITNLVKWQHEAEQEAGRVRERCFTSSRFLGGACIVQVNSGEDYVAQTRSVRSAFCACFQ